MASNLFQHLVKPKRGKLIQMILIFDRVHPWARPRKGKQGQMYQPKDKHVGVIHQLSRYKPLQIDEPVIMDSVVFMRRPKENTDPYPTALHFGDEDNLRKTINDCLVEVGIYVDDRWVLGGEHYKNFAHEDYAVIKIYSVKGFHDGRGYDEQAS